MNNLPICELGQSLMLSLVLLQIHAAIPTATKSLMEVQEQLHVLMANQQKLSEGLEGVSSILQA